MGGSDPYNFEDQNKPDWHFKQRQLAGTHTRGTMYDPPPQSSSADWTPPRPWESLPPPQPGPAGGGGGGELAPFIRIPVLVFAVTYAIVAAAAWLLGNADPAGVGLAAGGYALRVLGTVVVLVMAQAWAFAFEMSLAVSWLADTALVTWTLDRSATFILGAIAVTLASLAPLPYVLGWIVHRLPRAILIVALVALTTIFLIVWLPIHMELTIEGWRWLHKSFPWLLVI
jgi:hypothetical protein